jgi:hypothetical protein
MEVYYDDFWLLAKHLLLFVALTFLFMLAELCSIIGLFWFDFLKAL